MPVVAPVADEPVHESAPEQPVVPVISTTPTTPKQVKPTTKQAWDTKEVDINKITITLDEVKVEQLHNAPDLSPRTFVLPTKLLDTGTPVALLAAKGISVSTNPVVETQMDERIQPVSAELAATMTLDDWIARIPANIMDAVDEEQVEQWIIIPSLGVVTPVTNIPESNVDWTSLVNG